jgi:hypothetical protein
VGHTSPIQDALWELVTPGKKNATFLFWYSSGSTSWTQFLPNDDTEGFQENGLWRLDIPANSTTQSIGDMSGATSPMLYWIKAQRTWNSMNPTPNVSGVSVLGSTEASICEWDEVGGVTIVNLDASGGVTSPHISGDSIYAGTLNIGAVGAGVAGILEPVIDVGNLLSGTSKIFDKATDTLDNIPDGTTYKLLTAAKDGFLLSEAYTPQTQSGVTIGDGGVTITGASTFQIVAVGAVAADVVDDGGGRVSIDFDVGAGQINKTHIATNGVGEDEIDHSSGVSVASAVTDVWNWSISNPQDWGGGSASSPFFIGHFPAEVYPNGVYLVFLKVRNPGPGDQSSQVIFSEWTAGVSVALVDSLTSSGNVWVKDSSVSGAVIEADNDLFAEAVSGVCAMAGSYAFFPR